MPSRATSSSVYSMPFSSHTAASSGSIGRDASEMSVSPSQNSSNPSPVPGPSTDTLTSGDCSAKNSATSELIGPTERGLGVRPCLLGLRDPVVGQDDVSDFLDCRPKSLVRRVEIHVRLQRAALGGLVIVHIDEQRP